MLAGLSAGAMCWFEGGVSMSGGQPEVVRGIGLLPGIASVHLDGESERLPVFERAVATGSAAARATPPMTAPPSSTDGTQLVECVASRAQARVVRVEADGGRRRGQHAAAGAAAAARVGDRTGEPSHEPYGVSEMRALRAGRHRWD